MRHEKISDGLLLAWADGELPEVDAAALASHLESCWECRGRLADLERDLHRIAHRNTHGSWLAPERQAAAWSRLDVAMRQTPDAATPARAGARWWRSASILPFAAAAAFGSGLLWVARTGVWTQPAPTAATAPPPIHSARRPQPARSDSATAPSAPLPVLPPALPAEPADRPWAVRLTEAIEVHRILHHAGACTREGLHVVVPPNGPVLVRGLLQTTDRRTAITVLLREAFPAATLQLDLRSMDDAPALPDSISPSAPSASPALPSRIAAHDWLASRFAADSPSGLPLERRIHAFAEQAVQLSEAVNREVSALASLAELVPVSGEELLSTSASDHLQLLVLDHFRRLESSQAELRLHLDRWFDADEQSPARPASPRWQTVARQWREDYPRFHRAILNAFALNAGPVSPEGPSQVVAELRTQLAKLAVAGSWRTEISFR